MGKKSKKAKATKDMSSSSSSSWASQAKASDIEYARAAPLSRCANCYLDTSDNEKQLLCSNCKYVAYCSKECQKAHWKKEHKNWCHIFAQKKRAAKKAGHGRQDRLLAEWKDQLREGPLEGLVVAFYGMNKLRSLLKARGFINLIVAFDYNKRTFILQCPPKLVYTNELSKEDRSTAKEINLLYESMQLQRGRDVARYQGGASVIALITILGLEGSDDTGIQNTLMQFTTFSEGIQTQRQDRVSGRILSQQEHDVSVPSQSLMDITTENFHRIRLTSRKLDAWQPLRLENFAKQMDAIRNHAQIQPLLFHSLKLKANMSEGQERLHKTHTLVIHVEMGLGLGEIKGLSSFEIWPRSKVKENLDEEDKEQYEQIMEFCTGLLPDGLPCLLPFIIYLGKGYNRARLCRHIWKREGETPDQFSSDKKARLAFKAIQTTDFSRGLDLFPPLH